MNIEKLTKEEFYKKLHPSIHHQIDALLEPDGVDGMIRFENTTLDSSFLGESSVMKYGPSCKVKSLDDAPPYLNDLPSKRQYPVSYYEKDKGEKEGQ